MYFALRQFLNKESAGPGLYTTTCLSEQWHYKWPWWVRMSWPLVLVRAHRTRQCRCSEHAPAARPQPPPRLELHPACSSPPFLLHHHVCRRKMGRGARLMMVLTAYLSSGWRVMRHLSNLNIFHWAVMALSPRPAVCVCLCVCVRVRVCAFVCRLVPLLCVIGSAFES